MSRQSTRTAVLVLLAAGILFGAVGRWQSVGQARGLSAGQSIDLSYDEIVFLTLARNLRDGFSSYNTRDLYQSQKQEGFDPPAYLDRPVFKHPPLFALMLHGLGGQGPLAVQRAFLAMLCFGMLVSVSVYFLARLFLPVTWSLLAAVISWVDPILWTGSVKVWVDLPMTLFCLWGLLLAWNARQSPRLFPAAGVMFGLALLTKSSAVIAWAAAMAWLALAVPELRRTRSFWIGCLVPWLMVLPWLCWSAGRSGWSGIYVEETRHMLRTVWHFAWVILPSAGLIWIAIRYFSGRHAGAMEVARHEEPRRRYLMALILLTLTGLYCCHSWFSTSAEPRTGFSVGFFAAESRLFYVERILNLNPLLWPGLMALFLVRLPAPASQLRWIAVAWLVACTVWGNYQSRYITLAVPLLCILSAWWIRRIAEFLSTSEAMWLERSWVGCWVSFVVFRLCYIHQKMTIPNHFTYF